MIRKKLRKLLFLGVITSFIITTVGCGNSKNNAENEEAKSEAEYNALKEKLLSGGEKFPQLEEPKKGEEIAIIKTNMGEIKVKLCKDEAPKAVENFVKLSKDGYYNGLIIHRVVDNFVIQGGDPQGNGMGGESIWGQPFEDEFSPDMYHFRGALAMANSGPNTNGSQFYIVQSPTIADGYFEHVDEVKKNNGETELLYNQYTGKIFKFNYSQDALNHYNELGGLPELDYGYSIFGQVFEGIDVVDAIAKVETDSNDKPLTDVIIESISIEEYK